MSGKVGDREHLIAKSRDEKQVHLREQSVHFDGDAAAHPVGLHEIDGGNKSGLAEGVWLSVRCLHLEFVYFMIQDQLLESGCRFREEDRVE